MIDLGLLINAYDDGLSTGELRKFIPGMPGPSDFRKNLSCLLDLYSNQQYALRRILEFRLPLDTSDEQIEALTQFAEVRRTSPVDIRGADYLSTIIEGSALLERVARNGQAVVVFDQTDPFTVALGLRPTRYGFPLFWPGVAFSWARHPSPQRFFSDAAYVMVPVVPWSQGTLNLISDIYGPYLKANFDIIARSPHWRLWARKTAPLKTEEQRPRRTLDVSPARKFAFPL